MLGLLLACGIGACKSDPPAAPRPVVPAGAGIISGAVSFAGPIPPLRPIPESACEPGGPPIMSETVCVSPAGQLQNVIVYLENGPNTAAPQPPAPVVLDQVGCRYVPHVVAVRTGQSLRIKSSDACFHNVHGLTEKNPPFNLSMIAGAGTHEDVSFANPEILRVRCDVHPWMIAYIGVFDHPFWNVTGADGTFRLTGIPAGSYTLVAWHEKFGERRQPIVVSDEMPGVVSFRFGAGS